MRRRKRPKRPGEHGACFARSLGVRGFIEPFASVRGCLARKLGFCALAVSIGSFGISAPPLAAKQKKVPRRVTGVVLDQADNGIAGATVTMTDLQTGKKLAAYTKEGGQYEFSDLLESHDYEVQAEYKGASSEVRKASSFDTRNRIVLDLKIPPPKS